VGDVGDDAHRRQRRRRRMTISPEMQETMECAPVGTLAQETTPGLGGLEELCAWRRTKLGGAVEAGDWPSLSPPSAG
jgi:hypothetical protein